jgi:hypothetical protein
MRRCTRISEFFRSDFTPFQDSAAPGVYGGLLAGRESELIKVKGATT